MSGAVKTETFNCTPEQFYKLISDYEKYPEFLQEVSDCKVIDSKGTKKLVEYTVNIIKAFKYRLWMNEEGAPSKLSWELDGGDLFKASTGSWLIENSNGKTKATYSVDAKFKVFVPGPVAKALVSVNLPNMMDSYKKRVAAQYGK